MQMLNFRSSDQLDITVNEYLALTKTLSLIERGMIRWVDIFKIEKKCRQTKVANPRSKWRGYFHTYGGEQCYFPYGPIAGPCEMFEWTGNLTPDDALDLFHMYFDYTWMRRSRDMRPEWFGAGIRYFLETGEDPEYRKFVPRHIHYARPKRQRYSPSAKYLANTTTSTTFIMKAYMT